MCHEVDLPNESRLGEVGCIALLILHPLRLVPTLAKWLILENMIVSYFSKSKGRIRRIKSLLGKLPISTF